MAARLGLRRLFNGDSRAGLDHRCTARDGVCAAMAGARRCAPAICAAKTFLARAGAVRTRSLPVLFLHPARRFLSADACPGRWLEKDTHLAVANIFAPGQFFSVPHSTLPGDRRVRARPYRRRFFRKIAPDLSGLRPRGAAVLSGVGKLGRFAPIREHSFSAASGARAIVHPVAMALRTASWVLGWVTGALHGALR